MPDYHEMYLKLASAQADAIDALNYTMKKLVAAMQEAEQILLEKQEHELLCLANTDDNT